jgi:hypothetical protein
MNKSLIYSFGLIGQIGLVTAIPLVFFALLGRFFDNKLGTDPYLFLSGLVVATFFVFFAVKRTVQKAMKLFEKLNDEK